MRTLLAILALSLVFTAPAEAHHHHHHHHAHKATVETPECWESPTEWAMECNAAEEAELARIEAAEHAEPVEEALGLPEEQVDAETVHLERFAGSITKTKAPHPARP